VQREGRAATVAGTSTRRNAGARPVCRSSRHRLDARCRLPQIDPRAEAGVPPRRRVAQPMAAGIAKALSRSAGWEYGERAVVGVLSPVSRPNSHGGRVLARAEARDVDHECAAERRVRPSILGTGVPGAGSYHRTSAPCTEPRLPPNTTAIRSKTPGASSRSMCSGPGRRDPRAGTTMSQISQSSRRDQTRRIHAGSTSTSTSRKCNSSSRPLARARVGSHDSDSLTSWSAHWRIDCT
jgi:hypothetical protein